MVQKCRREKNLSGNIPKYQQWLSLSNEITADFYFLFQSHLHLSMPCNECESLLWSETKGRKARSSTLTFVWPRRHWVIGYHGQQHDLGLHRLSLLSVEPSELGERGCASEEEWQGILVELGKASSRSPGSGAEFRNVDLLWADWECKRFHPDL